MVDYVSLQVGAVVWSMQEKQRKELVVRVE
jgi:hypothetical protein